MSKKFVYGWMFRAFVLFMFGIFFGMSLVACAKDPGPDPVNAPLTAEQERVLASGKAEEAKYGYNPPHATTWDKADNMYRGAKDTVNKAAVTTGQFIGTVIFHLLLWVIPFLVIVLIPGFITGRAEMAIEGLILIICGGALLGGNWVGELGLAHWVWICMILPGAILIVVTFFVEEGPWKIAVVFGGQLVMTLLAIIGLLNSAMSALIHGSFLALAVVALILYGIFSGDDEPAKATS